MGSITCYVIVCKENAMYLFWNTQNSIDTVLAGLVIYFSYVNIVGNILINQIK